MNFGNELSEIKFIRRILLEFGVFGEADSEIDQAITFAKVDQTQDRMDTIFEQENKK